MNQAASVSSVRCFGKANLLSEYWVPPTWCGVRLSC